MFPLEFRPFQVTGLLSLLLYIVGAIWGSNQLDITIYNTYFILGVFHLCALFGLIYVLNMLGYWLTRNRSLFVWPLYLHLLTSIIFATVLSMYIVLYSTSTGTFQETNPLLEWNYQLMFVLLHLSLIFWLIGQIFFLFNILIQKN